MSDSADLSQSSTSTSDSEDVWTENEGETTEEDEETPAHPSLRGMTALVTASCPRKYPRTVDARRKGRVMLPDDFSKDELLKKFRRVFNTQTNSKIEKATCHDEPHKRFKKSGDQRERHKHIALKTSTNFAHKKIADAFWQEHGLRISFSFRLKRFVANLEYLMEAGKKPSTDVDRSPAKFPPNLNLEKEMGGHRDPRDAEVKAHKRRKRLTFDEVSNIIIEGVGNGPLKSRNALEAAAKQLKLDGKVELWNYVGELRSAKDVAALVTKVWRLHGCLEHPLFHKECSYKLDQFSLDDLRQVAAWRKGLYKQRALVLSGDGGLGKTGLAEALAMELCSQGYWFVDDPDDFRELDGLIEPGHVVLVDEVTLYVCTFSFCCLRGRTHVFPKLAPPGFALKSEIIVVYLMLRRFDDVREIRQCETIVKIFILSHPFICWFAKKKQFVFKITKHLDLGDTRK